MRKGDVCTVRLMAGIGHEQYGERPAILISDTKTGIIIVVPLTSNLEALKFPYTLAMPRDKQNNLNNVSVALIFQIRAVDKSRIIKVMGRVSADFQRKIDKMLRGMLKL